MSGTPLSITYKGMSMHIDRSTRGKIGGCNMCDMGGDKYVPTDTPIYALSSNTRGCSVSIRFCGDCLYKLWRKLDWLCRSTRHCCCPEG